MTWEDYFYKPKLLLTEYINKHIKNSQSPAPSCTIIFYIAELPLEKLPQDISFNAAGFARTIITCENNYSRENN